MFKPKSNTTSSVYDDVKTQYKVGSILDEEKNSTVSVSSSSTDANVAVPVQDSVEIENCDLTKAGKPCPDYGKQNPDFTSREQLSEYNFRPNDL